MSVRKIKGEFEYAVDQAIAKSLSAAMKRKNTSCIELGRVIGVHPNIISLWKTGKVTPSIANILKLIDYFDDMFVIAVNQQEYYIDKEQ